MSTRSHLLAAAAAEYSATVEVIEKHRTDCEAADALAKSLHSHGIAAHVRGEAGSDGLTLVVFAKAEPAHIERLLDDGGVSYRTVDIHDAIDLRIRTYAVRYAGAMVLLVATAERAEQVAA